MLALRQKREPHVAECAADVTGKKIVLVWEVVADALYLMVCVTRGGGAVSTRCDPVSFFETHHERDWHFFCRECVVSRVS